MEGAARNRRTDRTKTEVSVDHCWLGRRTGLQLQVDQ